MFLKKLNFYSIIIAILVFSSHLNAQSLHIDSLITKDILQQHVQALAHDSMEGRYTGTEGCKKAAAYISREMAVIGLQPLDGNENNNYYFHYFKPGLKDTLKSENIIGLLPGKSLKELVLFSAHYDHVGDASKKKQFFHFNHSTDDMIYNGANDNASGVAALLALANYYKKMQIQEYSVAFVAFSGEELGLYGSTALANWLPEKIKIIQVVNLEMLGRPKKNIASAFVTEGPHSYGFSKKLNKNLAYYNKSPKEKFFVNDPFKYEDLFTRSDNYPFAIKGIPANTIQSTPVNDKYYHSSKDEWDTLNYEAMTEIVKTIAIACSPILQIP